MTDEKPKTLLGIVNLSPVWVCLAAATVLAAVVTGFWLDSQAEIRQPMLFWPLLFFGLAGAAFGLAFGTRNDRNLLRGFIAALGVLIAWRCSYFPFMVVAGWKGSLGEAAVHGLTGTSVVYPFFLFFLFAQNLGVAIIASAAVASPQGEPSQGRFQFLRNIVHRPPRKLLWLIAVFALPVAGMVSFSTRQDFVLFNDVPWKEHVEPPPIQEPQVNPYSVIIKEHELSIPAWVLAVNALITYPLVPESPWGAAMKGTLEVMALENPQATSRDRIDEHYLAYMAAHRRLHPENP